MTDRLFYLGLANVTKRLFLATLVGVALALAISVLADGAWQKLAVSACLVPTGLSMLALMYEGFAASYLPRPFLVSTSANPVQFWMTIVGFVVLGIGTLILGCFGVVHSIGAIASRLG